MVKKSVTVKPRIVPVIKAKKADTPKPQTTVTESSKPKVYSLIGNNDFIMPPIQSIVQLKLTRDQIELYEQSINFESGCLLKNISDTNSSPRAYNDSEKYQSTPVEQLSVATTAPKKSTIESIIKPIKPGVSVIPKTETTEEVEKRRNLIINSGIKRKVVKLMSGFDTVWPNHSEYDCWNDGCPFKTAPVGIPEGIKLNDKGEWVFDCYGNFCSYNCAARYLNPNTDEDYVNTQTYLDFNTDDYMSNQMQLLELLCQLETDMTLMEKIKYAPKRLTQKRFGGTLSIEQYRASFKTHDQFHIFKSPIVPISDELEEVKNTVYESKSKNGASGPSGPRVTNERIEKIYCRVNRQLASQ